MEIKQVDDPIDFSNYTILAMMTSRDGNEIIVVCHNNSTHVIVAKTRGEITSNTTRLEVGKFIVSHRYAGASDDFTTEDEYAICYALGMIRAMNEALHM